MKTLINTDFIIPDTLKKYSGKVNFLNLLVLKNLTYIKNKGIKKSINSIA